MTIETEGFGFFKKFCNILYRARRKIIDSSPRPLLVRPAFASFGVTSQPQADFRYAFSV